MKKLLSIILALSLTFSLTACSQGEEEVSFHEPPTPTPTATATPTATPTPTPTPTAEPTEEPLDPKTNPLTGEVTLTDEAVGSRPVAVMINNSGDSMPQYGINEADLIFEVTVEGNMTRLMAVFADYTQIPELCSIRSARYYFPIISESFDAIYVHCGTNAQFADPELAELGTDNIDGMYAPQALMSRDQNRLNSGYALEHTLMLSGPYLPTYLENNNFETEIQEDKKGLFFNFNKEETPAEGETATAFQFDYGYYYSDFYYDEENKVYLKDHIGSPQIDGTTGEQFSFKNVILLETPVNLMPNGSSGVKQIDVMSDGSKTGYYISDGNVEKITWKKETKQDKFSFYKADGSELSINKGRTYIGVGDPTITWK